MDLVTKCRLSSSNKENEFEDKEEEEKMKEVYDVDEADDVKVELLSLCDEDDGEISLEHECKKSTSSHKSSSKR